MHLVGEELSGGECDTGGDDALDGGIVSDVHVDSAMGRVRVKRPNLSKNVDVLIAQHYKLKKTSYKIDSEKDAYPTFENQKTEAPINDGVWVYQIDAENSIYITADKTKVEVQPVIPVQNGFNYVAPAAFNCIVGCYSQKENVEIFTKKLISNGFQVSLIQEGALTKVCIGQSNDATSLNSIVEKAKSLGLDPWMLH